MSVRFLQLTILLYMLVVIVRVSKSLQIASDHRGRLVMLGHRDRVVPLVARRHIDVTAHKVHEVCSQ